MFHTVNVDPDKNSLGWILFIDNRPVIDFNRDFEASINLAAGQHRLVVDARGGGSTVEVTIKNATLTQPSGAWPLKVVVPKSKTGLIDVAAFTTP